MFGNMLVESCQTAADLEIPRSTVEQHMGGEVHLLLFLCTPSLVARRCVESYVCMCWQRNTWVYSLWPFFFKMGSLNNNMCLIQTSGTIEERIYLQISSGVWVTSAVCGAGASDTSIHSYGLLPYSWYRHFFCCEFSVMCSQIRMATGHSSHRDAGI